MKLPGEAGGNWSERQTKARTYGHGLQLYSARVGRRPTYYLLYSRGEFLIHSPSLIPTTRPRPRARGSFIRPANYESSRRMSNRLNCEAAPQPKARAARESVSSCAECGLRDCDATPRTRSRSRSRSHSCFCSCSYSHARPRIIEERDRDPILFRFFTSFYNSRICLRVSFFPQLSDY